MKTKHSKFITAGMAFAIISPAFALEGPADDAPPPPQVAQPQAPASLPQFKLNPDDKPASEAKGTAKTEIAFLGVVSGDVPKFLAEHLDLEDGQGVIVRALPPDSPAANAGLVVNDVITSVAGQPVGTREELSARVTANKPGDILSLDVIHKGRPVKMDVTLGVRPADVAMAEPPTLDQLDLESLPKEMADHVRDALGGMELKLGDARDTIPPQMEEAIRELEKRMQGGRALLDEVIPPPPAADANIRSQSSSTFRLNDNDGSIEVKSKDGAKEVTVRDHQDSVVWRGPWDTDKDRAAAPDSVRMRMESLHLDTISKGPGLRFNFNKQADPATPDH